MTPATQEAYRKLAANFYAKQLKGDPPSPKRLAARRCGLSYSKPKARPCNN